MINLQTAATVSLALILAACSKPDVPQETEETTADVAPPVAQNCPTADESGVINIAPGLSARIIQAGYGRAAAPGDYADTNVWLWLYDEAAPERHGKFIW